MHLVLVFASGIAKVALVGSWACGSSCMIELTLGAVKGAWLEGVDVLIVPCGGFQSMGGGGGCPAPQGHR